jgi:hypothetical protein
MAYSSSGRSARIFVIAPPRLVRARRLADELYDQGWDAVLVDSPTLAAQAAENGTCIVVLTREQWRDPAIVAAVRARPPILIPVLSEPMPLPEGPWTEAPIEMRQPPREIARQIIEVIEDVAPPRASGPRYRPDDSYGPGSSRGSSRMSSQPRLETPSRPYDSLSRMDALDGSSAYMPLRPDATNKRGAQGRRKSRISTGGIAIISMIVAAVLATGGYFGYRYLQSRGGLGGDPSTSPYSASTPGNGCDHGGATWVNSADTKFTFTCQSGGLLVTQNGDYDLISGVGYQGGGNSLSPSYHVQVDAAIQSQDLTDTVGINVHQTKTPQNVLSGGQLFAVQSSGFWSVTRLNSDGSTGQRLADGVLAQPATKLTLAVDVRGAVMTFSANGQVVTTITDATYLKTDAIALVVSNHATLPTIVTGTNPVSAVFSHFSFAPITSGIISPSAAAATATAQASANLRAPYKATKPGPGCDTGKGQWAGPTFFGDAATASCAGGLHLSIPSSSKNSVGRAGFFWLDGNFPADYSVSVQATLNQINAGSVLISLRVTTDGRYLFSLNAQGQWEIRSADGSNNYSTIDQGVAAVGASVVITATVKGTSLTLALNGKQVASDTDSSETDTSYISLGIVGVSGQSSAATFSNFTFTPLSS